MLQVLFMLVFVLVTGIILSRQRDINARADQRGISVGFPCWHRTYSTPLSPEECRRNLEMENVNDLWRAEIVQEEPGLVVRFRDLLRSSRRYAEYQILFEPGRVRVVALDRTYELTAPQTYLTLDPYAYQGVMTDLDLDSFFIPKLDCKVID